MRYAITIRFASFAVSTALSLSACSSRPGSAPSGATAQLVAPAAAAAPTGQGPRLITWKDRWWLEKASRALRGGDSLKPTENADTLLALGREQVAQQFVNDPRFADTILDFNLAFLGFRQDRIKKESGNYKDVAYEFPEAVDASRAVLAGGDYFSLFDLEHPVYLGPLLTPPPMEDDDEQLDAPALRQKIYQRTQDDLDRMINMAKQDPPATPVQICTAFNEHENKFIFGNAYNLPPTLTRTLMRQKSWYGTLENLCNDDPIQPADFVSLLTSVKEINARFFAKLASFEPANYKTQDVSAIRALDVSDLAPAYKHTFFTATIQRALPNSSTNFDRKRGAYILKRFFCDDLTPVNVQTPAVHAGNRHASDPSCFACHYKLDPMAGFFRDLGSRFRDYSQRKLIYFDDGASADRVEYEKSWAPGPDADHPWNVGYIRSTVKPAANTYGSTINDLFSLLKTAPEVRRCLMKRMFEYFVSDRQAIDGDFLDYLTEQFSTDLKNGSVAAIKAAATRVVLSESFGTPGADSASCYDHRPGAAPSNGVPCSVASILSQNCVRCHNSTDQKPFLDLSAWKPQSDGLTGFPHLDERGNPLPTRKTLEEMLERISSTDSEQRMPYKAEMPTSDRQQLYVWINEQLKSVGGSGGAP